MTDSIEGWGTPTSVPVHSVIADLTILLVNLSLKKLSMIKNILPLTPSLISLYTTRHLFVTSHCKQMWPIKNNRAVPLNV